MITGRRNLLKAVPVLSVASPGVAAQRAASASLESRLHEALNRIEAVNTHEHIIPEPERLAKPIDFFTLAGHYAINDVVSAGLPAERLAEINNPDVPAARRWSLFEPYWNHARLTGYGQALRLAIRDIYGLEISGTNLPKINDAISARNKPGLYRWILKEKSRIRVSVLDDYWNATPVKPDPDFFVLAHKFDRFITPAARSEVEQLEKITGVSITSLAGLKQAMEASFRQFVDIGMATVKSTIAYNRELHFREVSPEAAERDFEALVRGGRPLPERFRRNVEQSRDQLMSLLRDLQRQRKRVVGYAATSKSTTVTNYCGITPDLVEYISDKIGRASCRERV